jgi:hypothetical protein
VAGRRRGQGPAAGSPEWRERVALGTKRGLALRRERLKAKPRDLTRLQREGLVAEALRPLVDLAELELREWLEALGGVDEVSPQRRAVLEDAAGLGIAFRAELSRFLASNDPAALDRLTSIAGARRTSLVAAGLEVIRPDPLSTDDYLEALRAQKRVGRENDSPPGADVAPDAEDAAGGDVAAAVPPSESPSSRQSCPALGASPAGARRGVVTPTSGTAGGASSLEVADAE